MSYEFCEDIGKNELVKESTECLRASDRKLRVSPEHR